MLAKGGKGQKAYSRRMSLSGAEAMMSLLHWRTIKKNNRSFGGNGIGRKIWNGLPAFCFVLMVFVNHQIQKLR